MSLPFDEDGLVDSVRRAGGDRPLDNITMAVELAAELGAAGDRVVSVFVDEARRAGLSWSQIGTSLGVTRQAAQQRFTEPSAPSRPRDPAPMGADGIRNKPAPFSGLRESSVGLNVQVEIGGAWYQLVELDGRPVDQLVRASREVFKTRWLKRLSEDLDDVYAMLGDELGDTAEVTLVDGAGRTSRRTVEVTIAKRKAAWRYNNQGLTT